MIQPAVAQRHNRVRILTKFFAMGVHRITHIQEDDVRTGRQDRTHVAVVQIQHVGDHLVLRTFEDAFVGALLQEHADLLQGHGRLLHLAYTE